MTGKLTATVTDFHSLGRNTLRGFAAVRLAELHLEIAGVAIHQKGDKRWVALPSVLVLISPAALSFRRFACSNRIPTPTSEERAHA
ncbi:hypothetical protein FXV83_15155 [Bradyrhizobium hipponense]|uniref:Uncharacterized protein n=1 Tax=Bradyrhizobium hipponense TaxID=2605638 RepID=A0A5S4YPA0_9BRAD|nr:hypothetical protein [Bradyrhizobium hipponense]TYO65752.1 hypothetical protein FXV83_15155 [Bradyrhizobium hipponense]